MEWTWLGPVVVAAAFLAFAGLLDRCLGVVRPARVGGLVLAAAVPAGGLIVSGRPAADGLAALAAAAVWTGGRRVVGGSPDGRRAARQGAALVGLGVVLAAWLAADRAAAAVDDGDGVPPTRVPLTPLPGVALATDRGSPVPAFAPARGLLDWSDPAAEEERFLREWQSAGRILRVAGPDPASNCHGWTFTGGRCWVRSEDVAAVLDENGYRLVDDPLPGDVAVYRGTGGQVCHTGLVVGTSRGGEVLVESKWAWAGRFVHPAAAQPYAPLITYHRSPRPDGHLLAGGR